MSLAPFLRAPVVIQVHAVLAACAFVLGCVQFAAPKGTLPHRTLGYIWCALIASVAIGSFWIHALRPGRFSAIHLLSVFTLMVLPLSVWRARTHRVRAHARGMVLLFTGALVVAGLFTLYPGRLMNRVVFGE